MRPGRSFMLPVIALFLAAGCSAPDDTKDLTGQSDWVTSVHEQVAEWYDVGEVVGAELLVIKDSDTVIHEVWGWADQEDERALELDMIFRIRSMTKPLIGTAVLMLAEEGRIELDQPVATHLEVFQTPHAGDITIRDLLYHTSGFTMGYPRGSIDDYESLDEAVADAAEQGPKYPPGTEYHYADADTAALGLIIEAVTGEAPEDFIARRIFTPLEMRDSYCLLGEEAPVRERVCSTYHWSEGRYQKYWDNEAAPETPFFRASGGVFCTSLDYSRFLAMWMDRGLAGEARFLPETTIVSALQPGPLSPDYAMHWQVYQSGDTGAVPPAFGHGGSDGTLAMALPEHNAMVLYFTQSRGSLSTMFLEKFILQELGYSEEKQLPEYVPDADIVGAYLGDFDLRGERWTVEGDDRGVAFRCDRLVPLRFVPIAEHTFEHPVLDMGIRFVVDDDGTCDELVFRSGDREVSAQRQSTSG